MRGKRQVRIVVGGGKVALEPPKPRNDVCGRGSQAVFVAPHLTRRLVPRRGRR